MEDARLGQRFPVHLPIKMLGGLGTQGVTENISAAGVYIYVDQTLEIDSRVEFEMTIPAKAIGATQDVIVHCSGRVVRNESQSSEKPGVACLIDEYQFVRAGART